MVHHDEEEIPNALQRWNGESVNFFMRWAYTVRDGRGNAHPNYNYEPDMKNAAFLSETIVSALSISLPIPLPSLVFHSNTDDLPG